MSRKTFWWTIIKNHNKTFQRIFVFEKFGKTWNVVLGYDTPLNFVKKLHKFNTLVTQIPWVPEATRLLNPAGQRPAKRVWGPKWAKRAKGRTRVGSGGEPQWSRYVWYRFCTWSLIGYSKTCFFQRPQLVRRGHVKWTGFFSKTEWCLVEKKCVQRRDFIEGENLYSVSSKFEKQ